MVVVAMPEELSLLKGHEDETIVCTGIGAVNVISALNGIPRDTPIHNVGYAGSSGIPIGTRCRIGTVRSWHPIADFWDPAFKLDGDVPCYTSSDFVTAADGAEMPCVFDMELAYILALGFTNVTAEKVVSDNLSEKEYEESIGKQVRAVN